MSLGQAKTKKFSIGTAELRVGPLTDANKLLPVHSVGLVDSVTVTVNQESVDLEGGFPKKVVDTAIVSQSSEVTGTLREYSRRNMQILLGEGIAGAEPADIATTVATAGSATDVDLEVPEGEASTIVAGDFVVVYPSGSPELVGVYLVDGVTPTATQPDVINLNADTPLIHDVAVGDLVFVAHQIPLGAIQETNYFSVQVIQRDNSSGRPVIFNFWKAAISTGLEYGTNADDFASTDLTVKILEPAACEYEAGGDLEHLANIIPSHPTGMFINGADDASC